MTSCEKTERISQQVSAQHVVLLEKGCKEEVPLTSPSSTVRKRNVSVQCPFTFHFSFVKIQLPNNWAASSPFVAKKPGTLRCFTQDEEKIDDPV